MAAAANKVLDATPSAGESPSSTRRAKRPAHRSTRLSPQGTSQPVTRAAGAPAAPLSPLRYRPTELDRGLRLPPIKLTVPARDGASSAPPPTPARRGSTAYRDVQDALARKAIIRDMTGANTWILAIAMMEGDDLHADYVLGDAYPPTAPRPNPKLGPAIAAAARLHPADLVLDRPLGFAELAWQRKLGDAANYGIYRMNWFMIRQTSTGARLRAMASARQPALDEADLADAAGASINAHLRLSTQIILEAWNLWGHAQPDASDASRSRFWAGQRWGETGFRGLSAEQFADMGRYYAGVAWIEQQCRADKAIWTNGTRYWYEVPPI